MTGAEALRAALPGLRAAGVEDPARDARLLLAHAMGIASDRLTLHLAERLSPAAETAFGTLLAARQRRQPVSQLTGHRQFWGRVFRVTPDVLDPRPETETLVAIALTEPFFRVLDLGTGTGCLLLTLLHERQEAIGTGVELSVQAMEIAKENCTHHGLDARAALLQGSWFDPVSSTFDLIVANPPYIAAHEMPHLAPEVRDWEPHLALTPGDDGLEAYRAIAAGAGAHLVPRGRLLLEIGPTQGAAVSALLHKAGFAEVTVHPDLDGRDRVVAARAP